MCAKRITDNDLALQVVNENWKKIKKVKNPSFQVCLEAYKKNPEAILRMKNPPEEFCIYAVQDNPENIKYMKEPTHNICMETVKGNGRLLSYIERPTLDIIKVAVEEVTKISTAEMPEKDIYLNAIKYCGLSLLYINEPSDEMIREAIKRDISELWHVEEQTEDLCLWAVSINGLALKYVINQTDKIYDAAVKQNPKARVYKKEFMQREQYIDYILENEGKLNSKLDKKLSEAKENLKKIVLEYIVKSLNPVPQRYEWTPDPLCHKRPYERAGSIRETGKLNLEQTVSEFLNEFNGKYKKLFKTGNVSLYTTYGDCLFDEVIVPFFLNVRARTIKSMIDESYNVSIDIEDKNLSELFYSNLHPSDFKYYEAQNVVRLLKIDDKKLSSFVGINIEK